MQDNKEHNHNSVNSESENSASTATNNAMAKPKAFYGFAFLGLLVVAILVLIGYLVYLNRSKFVVARVGNTFITRMELNDKLASKYGKQEIDNLVTVALIKQALQEQKIVVSNDEYDAKVKEIEATLTGTTLDEALKTQGMSRAEFDEQIRLQIGVEKLMAEKATVSDQDIQGFIDQYKEQLKGKSADEQKAEAVKYLKSQKLNTEISTWLEDLKSKTKVEKYL